MYYNTLTHIKVFFKRHPYWEKTCGIDSSYFENGISGGQCTNFSEVCCTSTNTGLKYLKEKGMLEELPQDGAKIITSPSAFPFFIPPYLKHIPIAKWTVEERKWLNMYETKKVALNICIIP